VPKRKDESFQIVDSGHGWKPPEGREKTVKKLASFSRHWCRTEGRGQEMSTPEKRMFVSGFSEFPSLIQKG
jgi:hypothetical protein